MGDPSIRRTKEHGFELGLDVSGQAAEQTGIAKELTEAHELTVTAEDSVKIVISATSSLAARYKAMAEAAATLSKETRISNGEVNGFVEGTNDDKLREAGLTLGDRTLETKAQADALREQAERAKRAAALATELGKILGVMKGGSEVGTKGADKGSDTHTTAATKIKDGAQRL